MKSGKSKGKLLIGALTLAVSLAFSAAADLRQADAKEIARDTDITVAGNIDENHDADPAHKLADSEFSKNAKTAMKALEVASATGVTQKDLAEATARDTVNGLSKGHEQNVETGAHKTGTGSPAHSERDKKGKWRSQNEHDADLASAGGHASRASDVSGSNAHSTNDDRGKGSDSDDGRGHGGDSGGGSGGSGGDGGGHGGGDSGGSGGDGGGHGGRD